jgi:hypothetical protein
LTPVSKLKVPLPRFPLCREDEEDGAHFLVRVEHEARNIVGSYMCMEHEACIASLPNTGRLNRVLEVVVVAYMPPLVPVSAEVLKKRKVDATMKASAKNLKVPEKKGAEAAKVSRARASGGLKRPLGANILLVKSAKLSKVTIPCKIASVAATRIMLETHGLENLLGASGSKASGGGPSYKTVPEAKKAARSAKKCIVPAIGAPIAISLEGT